MTVTIMDGGMGQELVARTGKATGLWATQALLDDPSVVRAVHDEYFAAGAQVATTNTYAVLPDRFETYDISDRLEEITQLACQIAVQSRDAHGDGQVLGALGPLGFSYQPDKAPPSDQAAESYAHLARVQAPFVDVHLAETMSSVDQARGALMGMSVTGKPIWIALSVNDDDGTKLRSGEALKNVFPLLTEFKAAVALINCSKPEAVSQAVPILAKSGIVTGAYANGFTAISEDFDEIGATVDILKARKDLDPPTYADFAAEWLDAGATLVGGCCEVGPDHIRELSRRFS